MIMVIENLKDLRKAYRTILGDNFLPRMEISFYTNDARKDRWCGDNRTKRLLYELVFGDTENRQKLIYDKVGWEVGGEVKGLRYGENPGQEAALYRLTNGNLVLGDVKTIQPGQWLVSDAELLQSGKHPGKINLTDADAALGIIRYLQDGRPVVAIMKHNNPCGVARKDTLEDAYHESNMADRLAAFGGAIALSKPVDKATAEMIAENYSEVVVAPGFENGVMDILAGRKNLRVMEIKNIERLYEWDGVMYPEFKSLIDGGQIVQWPYVPKARKKEDITVVTDKEPTERQYRDMLFGWLIEVGVTSNSILYVKDEATVGIGTGEQDRVGAAKIARSKAMEKYADRIAFENLGKPLHMLPKRERYDIMDSPEVKEVLTDSCMISDAFFPFRDGVEVGLEAGVKSVIQPGGSQNDQQVIDACNEYGAAMVFTGQRSFKH
jgi:phosphoribosylaminoimidazolecarboxamide formyltransferase/IMP cyclohydrolase